MTLPIPAISGTEASRRRDDSRALRELRRQFSYLVENLPGVVYRCQPEAPWQMLFISKRVEELTGYRREEFEQGRTWADLVHPDDLPALDETVAEGVASSRSFSAIYRILHRSGEIRWVREQGQMSSVDGEPPFFLDGFIDDITAQRELELSVRALEVQARQRSEVLASVLESTTDCVYSLDREWRFTYLNGRAVDYFGQSKSLLGQSILSVFPDAEQSVFADMFRRAMDSGEPATGEGYVESRRSWYELHVSPRADGITVFFRDVTERKKLEQLEREAAFRWRCTLEVIPQMVWSMAGDARKPDYYNDRWYEFTGLPHGSLQGREWKGIYHPDDRLVALDQWRACRSSGAPYEAEYRVRDRHGQYRWVVSRARAERDASGKVVRWYGTCTDVHDAHLHRAALEASEKRAHAILDSIPQVIWLATPEGKIDFLSNQWSNTYDADKEAILGDGWMRVLHPEDRERAGAAWMKSLATGEPYETEFRVKQPNGEYLWTLVRAVPERSADGSITRWYGTCTDIHDRVVALHALDQSAKLNRGIVEASPDCMSVLDADGKVLFVNQATLNAYATTDTADLVGRPWGNSFQPSMRRRAEAAVATAQAGGIGRFVLHGGADGNHWFDIVVAPIKGTDGVPINLVVISRDFTEQKEAEEKAQWAANHDALTHLPNRFLLQKRIEEEIARCEDGAPGFSLLLIDLDHLKRVNDGSGHDAGDVLLCEFGRRLKEAVRSDDTVARLGGDEFAVVLPGINDAQAAAKVEQAILERLAEPYSYAGRMLECQGSIGASIYPQHGRCRAELLKNADVALYVAKASSRGRMKIFEPKMREEMQLRTSMLSIAKDALRNDWIVPHYQPKIDISTGRVHGFEALLRWNDPTEGLQLPCTIAAAFEDMELAAEISDQMIAKVITDMQRWRDAGVEFGHVAINAAAAEFRRGDFVDRLLERLSAAGLSTSQVQLEVTETVFLGRGAEYVDQSLRALSAAGIKIALDDFGTGFASLSHLNQFPVDYLKIDKSFMQSIGQGGAAIVDAVISLGRSLGIGVVAEGIETVAQHDFLLKGGCHLAQGFLYSMAVPADAVPGLARSRVAGEPKRWLSAA